MPAGLRTATVELDEVDLDRLLRVLDDSIHAHHTAAYGTFEHAVAESEKLRLKALREHVAEAKGRLR